MQNQPQRIIASTQNNATVIEFKDPKILDEINISQISQQIDAVVKPLDKPMVVLDFSKVAHMSSAALGMLITLQKHVRERGGQLRLCGIRAPIYEVFVITKLNQIFQIFDGREAALASLEQTLK